MIDMLSGKGCRFWTTKAFTNVAEAMESAVAEASEYR